MPTVTDTLLNLPDTAAERLLVEFDKFWALREKYVEYGFTHKRGMLLWGPPGSGKTCAIGQMTQVVVRDHNGVVVFIDRPQLASACVGLLRRIEPERPVVMVMEDLDELVERWGAEHFLALLDGNAQTANVLHVATTNHPDRLDRRFVDRPSRFDTIMEVGMSSAQTRRAYFKAKEPSLDDATLDRWVEQTKRYNIAHLREVIIGIKLYGQNERSVFERLNSMRQNRFDCESEDKE